jgi:hypothetical protein
VRNYIVEIERGYINHDPTTVIKRQKPGTSTLVWGHKPHIFRQGGHWILHGNGPMRSDFYKLAAFVANLNAGV